MATRTGKGFTSGERLALGTLAMAVAAWSGCTGDDPMTTSPPAELRIVSGSRVADTIQSLPAQAVTIEVVDAAGRPVPDQEVRFVAPVGIDGTVPFDLSPIDGNVFGERATMMTDRRGLAGAVLRLGTVAEEQVLTIRIVGTLIQAEAEVATLPGNAVTLSLTPGDTAAYAGRSYPLRTEMWDRFGNVVEGTPSIVPHGGASFEAGTVRAGPAPARSFLVGSINAAVDTAWLSVVPPARVAVRRVRVSTDQDEGLLLMDTDGSGIDELLTFPDPSGPLAPDWSPDGETLMLQHGDEGRWRLFFIQPDGALDRVTAATSMPTDETFGRFSGDGWIYFSGTVASDTDAIWKVRPDGSELTQVSEGSWQRSPISPSRDGRTLAVSRSAASGEYALFLLDPASGSLQPMGIRGEHPRWSPTADSIAFTREGRIWLTAPDGSGQRIVSDPTHRYQPGLGWSPDGEWLVAGSETLHLIHVPSGLTLPVPFASGRPEMPAWRPVP